jgi:hypothetical protein
LLSSAEVRFVWKPNTDAGGVTNNENPGQLAFKDWLMNKGGRCFQEMRGRAASPPNTSRIVGWIKAMPNKGRFIYTALGHETAEWSANGNWLSKMTWAFSICREPHGHCS